jgi:hypothetical protein
VAQRSLGFSRADIKPETVEWLWKRRIPKGKVTARDGDPGTGKSLSLYDLGARITSGNPMPDSHHTQRAGALIISAEDGAAGTIVPRFLRAGGTSKQARIMGNDRLFVSPDGLDKLERAIRQVGASFVATDPIMCFLSDSVNSNRDQVVRRALQPLVGYAPRRTCAPIVICRHLNKSTGGQSLYRGQGSIRFIGVVRSGLLAGNYPERDGVLVLAGQKHDLSKPPESLAYRIRDTTPGDETAVSEHLGVSAVTAQQMTSTPEDEGERYKLTEAKEFLRGILSGGPEFTKKIKAETVEAEIGWRTIERAKGQLKIHTLKDSESGRWIGRSQVRRKRRTTIVLTTLAILAVLAAFRVTSRSPRRAETAEMALLPLPLVVIWLIQGKIAKVLMAVYTQRPRTKTANTTNLRTKIARWLMTR